MKTILIEHRGQFQNWTTVGLENSIPEFKLRMRQN